VATLIAAAVAWRAWSTAEDLARAPVPAAAEARAAAPRPPLGTLRAPSLELRPGTTLRGAPVELQGEAPRGEFVALLVDGQPAGVALVRDGRFAVAAVELSSGEHQVSVVAYRRDEPPVESARVFIRYEAPPVATPGPTPAATPAARPGLRPPSPSPSIAPVTRATPSFPSPSPTPPATPAAALTPRPHGRNILRGRADQSIALTFDGGSEAGQAEAVLAALRDKGVRSTIFLTGDFIELHPETARHIAAEGHEVGNHTLHHPHLADWVPGRGHITRKEMTRELLLRELAETRKLYQEVTGHKMSRYWRAPYGEINNQLLAWAEEDGWVHVGWTEGLDTLDWVPSRSDRRYRSAAEIRERLLAKARTGEGVRGGIVLMHLGSERSGDHPSAELPTIIDGLRAEGYRIVTVTALLGG
jgi:peptidoglycan/xylan/chitin deacetylase (PgdA/CDA1 family)